MDNEQTNIPYQGPYTGEQIDQAIERALTPHVEKFNGRTGAVTPQSGDYSAEEIGLSTVAGMTANNVQEAVEELFQSVSEGKTLIASAVTDKGVPTAADATFQTIHDNILAIETGGGLPDDVYSIILIADPPEGGTVSGGGYASAGMTCNAKAESAAGYTFSLWKESGTEVSEFPDFSFVVSANRTLTASFAKKPSRLPSGYTEVLYIQSGDGQYINAGIMLGDVEKVVMDVEPINAESGYFFGGYYIKSSGYSPDWLRAYKDGDTNVEFRLGSGYNAAQISVDASNKRVSVVFDKQNKTGKVDSESVPLPTGSGGSSKISLSLLAGISLVSDVNKTVDPLSSKLYSCQVYSGSDLHLSRDFVPCINPDGVPGVYDLVLNAFSSNGAYGEANFIAGPAI